MGIGRIHHFRTIQTLLTLALLHQEMAAAVPIEGKFAASGSANSLLRAAVGLELRHTDERV